ncbi:unnamed protein product [Linum trigynum]|uniref:Uncharacterized protein n=1 Tax=Linum trigynum TaxID=586398 RepID=A0AAV2GVC6_9ROSI
MPLQPGAVLITAMVLATLILLMIIMSPLPTAVAAESDDHRCTCKRYSRCDGCDTDRCCSPSGYCGSGRGYCRPCDCKTKGCCVILLLMAKSSSQHFTKIQCMLLLLIVAITPLLLKIELEDQT